MSETIRSVFHRYIPSHFSDPLGLAFRLLKSRDPAALLAINTAAMGIPAWPLDTIMHLAERRLYRDAPARRFPVVFVCGPPRSGTTVAMQTLVNHLPVFFLTNLTAVFPKSPLTATRLFQPVLKSPKTTNNYYGKTRHLAGPNDALFIWDRWIGKDRAAVPQELSPAARQSMRQFFDACEHVSRKPMAAKCNSLNTFAHQVFECMQDVYFICMDRDPLFLAQSLYAARIDIHGNPCVPYGVVERPETQRATDPIDSVCRQVLFHRRVALQQLQRIGEDRFWIVRYKTFCDDPNPLLERVRKILPDDLPSTSAPIGPIACHNRVKLDRPLFNRLRDRMSRLADDDQAAFD